MGTMGTKHNFSLDEASAIQRKLIAEEDTKPRVQGVFSIKVKTATLVNYDRKVAKFPNAYVSVVVRNFFKRTKVVSNIGGVLNWDQTKHFSVPVVKNKRHPFNVIRVNLMGFDDVRPEDHQVVGSLAFHLHDIISASPVAGRYDVWNEKMMVGDIELEMTFNYGMFGYGYSAQLKEEEISPEEMITYSLFPRVAPPEEEREPEQPVLVVKATPHPSFIPFKDPIFLSYAKEIEPALQLLDNQLYKPEILPSELDDFEHIRDEYGSFNDRVERVMFLHDHIQRSSTQQERIAGQIQLEPPEYSAKSYTRYMQPMGNTTVKEGIRNVIRRRFTASNKDSNAEKDKTVKQANILKTALFTENVRRDKD